MDEAVITTVCRTEGNMVYRKRFGGASAQFSVPDLNRAYVQA